MSTEPFSFKKISVFGCFFADPVRLGMQIAFGRVRPQNRTYRVWGGTYTLN